jgi:hypothetical protein
MTEVVEFLGLKLIYLEHAATNVMYSFIIFTVLFILTKIISPMISSTYSSFSFKKKLDWDCRIPSTINAIIGVYFAIKLYFLKPEAFVDYFNYYDEGFFFIFFKL